MNKELEANVEYLTFKKPKYFKLYITDDSIDTIAISGKEYRCSDIVKHEKALEIIKKLPDKEKQVLLNTVYTYTKSEEEYNLLKEVLL